MKLKYYMRGLGIGIILTTLILSLTQKELSDSEITRRAMELGMVLKEDSKGNLDDVYHGKDTKKPQSNPSEKEVENSKTSEPEKIDVEENTDSDSENNLEEGQTTDADNAVDEGQATDPDNTIEEGQATDPDNTIEEGQAGEADNTVVDGKTPDTDNREEDNETIDSENVEENNPSNSSDSAQSSITFTIEPGMSSNKVSILLKELGLVEDNSKFNEFVLEEGMSELIRVGSYTLQLGASYQEILDTITQTR